MTLKTIDEFFIIRVSSEDSDGRSTNVLFTRVLASRYNNKQIIAYSVHLGAIKPKNTIC